MNGSSYGLIFSASFDELEVAQDYLAGGQGMKSLQLVKRKQEDQLEFLTRDAQKCR